MLAIIFTDCFMSLTTLSNLTRSFLWSNKRDLLIKFCQKWYCKVGIYIMKYTGFWKVLARETREKSCFSSLAALWSQKILRGPHAHARTHSGILCAVEREKNHVDLLYPTLKLFLAKSRHISRDENLKFDCCIEDFFLFPIPKTEIQTLLQD